MNRSYSEYHPKWYRRRIPIFWWIRRFAYTKFIAREMTSLGVAYAALLLLAFTWALARGPIAFGSLMELLQWRPLVFFHVFILVVLLFHTVTWLNLAPKALVMRLGRRRVPDAMVLLGHYLAWLVASAGVVWLLLVRL